MTDRGVRRVIPMVFGWETCPLWISLPLIDDARRDTFFRAPVPGLLLEVDGGWFLVDSGFNAPLVRDPALYRRLWGSAPIDVELAGPSDRDPLEAAFELAGVDPRDVVGVCISHFHNDHSGGLRHFAGQCPVYIQRAEYDAGMSTDRACSRRPPCSAIDWDDARIDWRILDGDAAGRPRHHGHPDGRAHAGAPVLPGGRGSVGAGRPRRRAATSSRAMPPTSRRTSTTNSR